MNPKHARGWMVAPLAGMLMLFAGLAAQAQPLLKSAIQVDPGNTKLTGQTFGYRLTYNCSSTSGPCIGAQVVDLLPIAVQFDSTVPASPGGDVAAINVTPNFGGSGRTRVQFVLNSPLTAGNSGDLLINVHFPNGSTPNGTTATNTADGINLETAPGTFTTPPVTVTAVASVQVSVAKTLLTPPANLDMSELYQLQIAVSGNAGSLNLTAVGPVTDTLPPGAVFNGATPAADCQPGCVGTTPATVTWTSPCSLPVQAGNVCNIQVGVTFPSATFPSGTNVTNSFVATGTPLGQPPQVFGPGQVTHPVTAFVAVPDLGFTKIMSGGTPDPPTLNQTFSYELSLANAGNVPLDNMAVIDTLPIEMQVQSVTTGAYNGAADFAAGVGVRVSYEKNTALGVFTLWGSSPNTTTSTTLTAPPPGLGAGEYITRIRWQFGQAAVGMGASTRPQITGQIINPDHAGGPVAFGDTVQNCADITATYTAGPTNLSRNSCHSFVVSGPFVQLDPSKTNLSGGGPFNPGQAVSWRLQVRSASQSSDPVPVQYLVATDLLPVDLVFVTWTFDDQGTGLPAPQVFDQIPNFAGTGRTLLRWRWNAGSGSLGVNQQVRINITTTIRNGAFNGPLNNDFTLEHDAPGLAQRCSGSSQADPLDYDGDADTGETLCRGTGSATVAPIAQLISNKQVAGVCDGGFTGTSAGTLIGGKVQYRLRVQNVGTVSMQNFVLVDILPFVGDTGVRDTNPRGSQWTPLLAAPIVPPAGTTLYYSTSGNPCRGEVGGPTTSCDPPNWTTAAPDPITSVRSFKVEFGSQVVDPFDFVEFTFDLTAPANLPAAAQAFNSFAYQADRADGIGSLAAEPQKVGIALGTCPAAALGDFVWADVNGDGIQNDGPTGLNGVYVRLFQPGPDGVPGTPDDFPVASAVTANGPDNAPGWYSFPGLAPASYLVCFTAPPTFDFTLPGQGSAASGSDANPVTGCTPVVTLGPNQVNPDVDAGLVTTHLAALGNYVWFDRNGDGVQNEPPTDGINGVTVRLFVDDGDGNPEPGTGDVQVATTVTADDVYGQAGYYLFDGLVPGLRYFVQFVQPASATGFTTRDAGGNDSADSDAALGNGATVEVILAPDEVNRTLDAGLVRPVGVLELGDQVWLESDNDGIYEPQNGEAGIDDVRLFLYRDANGDGQPSLDEYLGATTSATASGFAGRYRFTGLAAGTYIVVIDPLAFNGGGALSGKVSATGNDPAPDPDDDVNGDDNGTDVGALIASRPVTLSANGEPTSEDGNANTNLTVDFGFIDGAAAPAPPVYDYGDDPDVVTGTATNDYNTTALDAGAHHRVGVANAPRLGACVDADGGFAQDVAASGDDTTTSATTVGTCAAAGDDEDGVTFGGPFAPGGTATFNVTAGGPTVCVLNAWVDWNHSGVFGDSAGEQIATNLAVAPGPPAVLSPAVPAGAIPGLSYARFRCASAMNVGPTGLAADGEVEDYAVGILGFDFGDAPASYGTQGAGAASHTVAPTSPLRLGGCVDTEGDGQPNAGAAGDDTTAGSSRAGNCFDDEEGVSVTSLIAGCQSVQLVVTANRAGGFLNAWFDWNGDGDFTDGNEQVFTSQALAAGANALSFTAACVTPADPLYARFRLSTQSVVGPTGAAPDGEVEDYVFGVAHDFGDAPATYGTLAANNGPNHVVGPVFLGTRADAEADGQPTAGADGDDLAPPGADDEDGVAFLTLPIACKPTSLMAAASVAGFLNAWVDFNRDGDFGDAGEQVLTNQAVIPGANSLTFNTPCSAAEGVTYARFRLTSAAVGSPSPTGAAPDGEVEDYRVVARGSDFGDAPNSYHTAFGSNGPLHGVDPTGSLFLGSCADTEDDAAAPLDATGDDVTAGSQTAGTCVGNDDEDGVTPATPFIACQSASVNVTAGAAGRLDAWMDFNRDGDFADAGEQIFTSLAVAAGANALSLSVPCTASAGLTYARYRLSSAGGLAFDGPAPNGEVEDYAVLLGSVDFGDAPDTYHTTFATGGPHHGLAAGFLLGAIEDSETNGQPSTNADADDLNGGPDDEDGVTLPNSSTFTACETANASVFLTNTAGAATPRLDAWIDFDGNGTFDDPRDRVATSLALVAGANAVTVNVPCDAKSVRSYARFRLSTSGVAGPGGPARDGEVEDYAVTVKGLDFGDAPDPTYPTLLASNGARHGVLPVANPSLGTAPDTEANGQPNATASGDDSTGTPDDEDGVVFPAELIPGTNGSVVLTGGATGGLASCWIDFNRDGDWADPGEAIVVDASVAAGAALTRTFPVTVGAAQGQSPSRCRISSQTGLGVTGLAPDGEIEDHLAAVGVEQPAIGFSKMLTDIDPEGGGIFLLTFEIRLENLGNVPLSNVNAGADLTTVFAEADSFEVVSLVSATLTPNPLFDGITETNFLAPGNTLAVGELGLLTVELRVNPGGFPGPYTCSSEAVGTSPGNVTVTDTSQDGPDPDPNGDGSANDNSDPTIFFLPVSPLDIPTLDGLGLMLLGVLLAGAALLVLRGRRS